MQVFVLIALAAAVAGNPLRPDESAAFAKMNAELLGNIAENNRLHGATHPLFPTVRAFDNFGLPLIDFTHVRADDRAALELQMSQLRGIIASANLASPVRSFDNFGLPVLDFTHVRAEDRVALENQMAQLRSIIASAPVPHTFVNRALPTLPAPAPLPIAHFNTFAPLVPAFNAFAPRVFAAPAPAFFSDSFPLEHSEGIRYEENITPADQAAQLKQLNDLGALIAQNQALHHNGAFPIIPLV